MTTFAAPPVVPPSATRSPGQLDGARPRLRQMPALDGLRGLAVAGVLLYHGGHLKGGWLGVDLFFVLSGYLITSLLLVEWHSRGQIDLVAFWGRRARRLFPAVVLLIGGIGGYALLFSSAFELQQIRTDGLSTLAYVANWHAIVAGHNYWQISLAPSPLQHTWSLAIEEQFYLLWPLLVLVALRWRRAVGAVVALSAALAVASVTLMIGLHTAGVSTARLYYGTDTRTSSILFGACLAGWQLWRGKHNDGGARWVTTQIVGLYSMAALLAAWLTFDGQSPAVYGGGLALCSLAAAAVIAAASQRRIGPLGMALSARPIRGLGLISYGVYLWHWPVFLIFDRERTSLRGWPLFGLQVTVTLAVALLSYVLVEQPVRERRLLQGRTALAVAPLAAGAAAAVLVATTLGAQASAIPRAGQVSAALAGAPGTKSFMVVGDSTAESLAEQMRALGNELGVTVVNRAELGCGLLYGLGPQRDFQGNTGISFPACGRDWARDATSVRPDVVLVLFGFPPVTEVRFGGTWHHACEAVYDAELRKSLGDQMHELGHTGSRVVLMTIPDRSESGTMPFYPNYTENYIGCVNKVLGQVADAGSGVTLLDINELLCPHGPPCPTKIDGKSVRADGLHFRDTDGPLVSRWVVQRALIAAGATQTKAPR